MSYTDALGNLVNATAIAAEAAEASPEGERDLAAEAVQYFRLLDFVADRMKEAFGDNAGYPEDSLVAYRYQEAQSRLNSAVYEVERFAHAINDPRK
ncbi:hypothetical protein [Glycomyces sp. NPDC048151]|uniref:hypothetical protein n=1 Tax=Glycomyces sp. NPDC048151 TaxID=3364002 RepID=UPI003713AAC1